MSNVFLIEFGKHLLPHLNTNFVVFIAILVQWAPALYKQKLWTLYRLVVYSTVAILCIVNEF